MTFRVLPGRPATLDPDGNQVAAVPASMFIRLTTKDGEFDAKSWWEFAEKRKAKGVKKDSSVTLQKIQVLSILGNEGWEIIELGGASAMQTIGGFGGRGGAAGRAGQPGRGGRASFSASSTTTMLLKRRAP